MTTKEKVPQLKTLEMMIVSALKNPTEEGEALRQAYLAMYNHFADEDYLHDYKHTDILDAIYKHDFYKTHNVGALEMKFHLDNKRLVDLRKEYLQLLTKHYLALDHNPKNFRVLLYRALKALPYKV